MKEESLREAAERLLSAAMGAVTLTADRVEQLADALASRGGIGREEARVVVEELASRWRGEAMRVSELAEGRARGLIGALGAVSREEVEELELRVSQLEHRLRLLEAADGASPLRPVG